MHWIMRACVAPDAASLPQDAGVAQDGAAVLAVTHAAQAGAAGLVGRGLDEEAHVRI